MRVVLVSVCASLCVYACMYAHSYLINVCITAMHAYLRMYPCVFSMYLFVVCIMYRAYSES
jgi:hypothetical protein